MNAVLANNFYEKEDYIQFIENKKITPIISGFEINHHELPDSLFDFQREIVKWALKRGRAAIFADTGLGKTAMQISWADQIVKKTNNNVLILAPLCVAHQTVKEGQKFGIDINYCRSHDAIKPGINITNYEMMDQFQISSFHGIVLDESSIIKNRDGKTRNSIIESCKHVPYKLSCTATPSPNDFMELGNQVEFLGLMSMSEMLAMYFIHDGGDTQKWVLKGHGKAKFWEWMATWSVLIKSPSDLGFDGSRYKLPALNLQGHVVESHSTDGLFADIAVGLLDRNKARRDSIDERVSKCAELVNSSSDQWVVWCHLNDESEMLAKLIPGSLDLKGSDSIDKKEKVIEDFTNGTLRVLITKPSIAGFGMNWQHCNNTAFVGLSDSWEQYYQAIRRFYRFGQTKIVNVHVISAESEGAVIENIRRKELQNKEMGEMMVNFMASEMKKEIFGTSIQKTEYAREFKKNEFFELHNADCIDMASEIQSNSIDYTIFSPPFSSLYTYSNSDRDMGNSRSTEEFYTHFKFLVDEMYRITRPGRLLSFHCMNLPTSKVNDGYIGIRDFRGDLIRIFQESGWIYHSEVVIWKNPVTAMQRTKALGLLHKTIRKDSSMSRQGIPDYLVTMRKPGANDKPISHTHDEFPVDLWQKYASPVWMDINPSNTLQFREAREDDDEKHICPLQLDVIERAIELWTAKGDLVFSPFTGIGSEGYVALKMDRFFIGSELKKSYYELALRNLNEARKQTMDLFCNE